MKKSACLISPREAANYRYKILNNPNLPPPLGFFVYYICIFAKMFVPVNVYHVCAHNRPRELIHYKLNILL